MNKTSILDSFRVKKDSLIIVSHSYENSAKICQLLRDNGITTSYGQNYMHRDILAWLKTRHNCGNYIGFTSSGRIRNMEVVGVGEYKTTINDSELFNPYEVALV